MSVFVIEYFHSKIYFHLIMYSFSLKNRQCNVPNAKISHICIHYCVFLAMGRRNHYGNNLKIIVEEI